MTHAREDKNNVRAISLTQPWATLLAAGIKTIETRSWATWHRGLLVIHASKAMPKQAKDVASQYGTALVGLGYGDCDQLPKGAIVGVCTVTEVLEIHSLYHRHESAWCTAQAGPLGKPPTAFPIPYIDCGLGDYSPGRYAWLTRGHQRTAPIPCKGALGLWRVPEDIHSSLAAELGGDVADLIEEASV